MSSACQLLPGFSGLLEHEQPKRRERVAVGAWERTGRREPVRGGASAGLEGERAAPTGSVGAHLFDTSDLAPEVGCPRSLLLPAGPRTGVEAFAPVAPEASGARSPFTPGRASVVAGPDGRAAHVPSKSSRDPVGGRGDELTAADARSPSPLRCESAGAPGVFLLWTTTSPVRAWLVEDLQQTDSAGARGRGWWLREIVERSPRRAWETWCRHSTAVPGSSSRRAAVGTRRRPPCMTVVGVFSSLADAKRAALGGA